MGGVKSKNDTTQLEEQWMGGVKSKNDTTQLEEQWMGRS